MNEDAEEHSAGQNLHEKHSVPAPLDNGNGKLVFSMYQNDVLTVLHTENISAQTYHTKGCPEFNILKKIFLFSTFIYL